MLDWIIRRIRINMVHKGTQQNLWLFFSGVVYRPHPIYEDNYTKVGGWLHSLSYPKLDLHKYVKTLAYVELDSR